jgi:hypothetical protein
MQPSNVAKRHKREPGFRNRTITRQILAGTNIGPIGTTTASPEHHFTPATPIQPSRRRPTNTAERPEGCHGRILATPSDQPNEHRPWRRQTAGSLDPPGDLQLPKILRMPLVMLFLTSSVAVSVAVLAA